MRWDRLFDDLEAQLELAERAELVAEIADRSRREVALTTLLDRLRGSLGSRIEVGLEGAGLLVGVLARIGAGWLLLEIASQPDALVPAAAIQSARGLPVMTAAVPPDRVELRLDLGFALRAVARDRSPVVVGARDGSRWPGTIDRVGADFIDLAEHASGEPRRAGEVHGVRTVSFSAISVVRSG